MERINKIIIGFMTGFTLSVASLLLVIYETSSLNFNPLLIIGLSTLSFLWCQAVALMITMKWAGE
jgi:hypothetical protein